VFVKEGLKDYLKVECRIFAGYFQIFVLSVVDSCLLCSSTARIIGHLLHVSFRICFHTFILIREIYSYQSDSLSLGQYGDQIPMLVRILAPVETGPGTHPASYSMATGSKSSWGMALTTHPHLLPSLNTE
jgi:hypothetical protein